MLRLISFLNVSLRALLLGGFVLLFSRIGLSVEVQDLYDVDIPVASRDTVQLDEAFEQALMDVLTRVTGKKNLVVQNDDGEDVFKKPAQYVQQYRYVESDDDIPQLKLWVRFDGPALEARLIRLGLPVWGKERPAVLVWLAIEESSQRYLAMQGSGLDAYGVIQAEAHRLKIPVIFPLLDLEDRNLVSVSDVIGGFDDRVLQASSRYRADAVLIGRATSANDGFWKTQWRLYSGGELEDWLSRGNDFNTVLRDGIEQTAMHLSSHLAVSYQSDDRVTAMLIVDGVEQLEDFARLADYIGSLSLVSHYNPHIIEANRATFQLTLRGTPRDLERLIDLGSVLNKVATPTSLPSTIHSDSVKGTTTPIVQLYYQLLPGN